MTYLLTFNKDVFDTYHVPLWMPGTEQLRMADNSHHCYSLSPLSLYSENWKNNHTSTSIIQIIMFLLSFINKGFERRREWLGSRVMQRKIVQLMNC